MPSKNPISKTIKVPRNSTMRVVATLAGFRARYGRWPEAIDIDPGMLAAMATELLTPLGFFLLQSKLEVTTHVSGTVVARSSQQGEPVQKFEYGETCDRPEISSSAVADWLGWDDPASDELSAAYFEQTLGM